MPFGPAHTISSPFACLLSLLPTFPCLSLSARYTSLFSVTLPQLKYKVCKDRDFSEVLFTFQGLRECLEDSQYKFTE